MTKARQTETTNLDLDVPGRLALFGALPRRGRYDELVTIANLQDLLVLSGEEKKRAGLVEQEDGSVLFNPQANFATQFKFSQEQTEMVKKTLQGLDQQAMLPVELLGLYRTVVLNGSS
jgi:hypothetical protein